MKQRGKRLNLPAPNVLTMQYTAVATELSSSGTANMRSEYARRAGSVDQRLPFTLAALPLAPLELANGPVPVCFASETARAISIPPSFRGMVTTSAVLFAAGVKGLARAGCCQWSSGFGFFCTLVVVRTYSYDIGWCSFVTWPPNGANGCYGVLTFRTLNLFTASWEYVS